MLGDDVRSIAILRALKLGDMLCVTPALRAIRQRWPRAHIALIALSWFRELAPRYSHLVDEMVEFPGYPGLPERSPLPGMVDRFIDDMQRRRFDLVVQMHGSGEITNPLIQRLGGRTAAGFYPPASSPPDPHTFIPWQEDVPESTRHLDLLAHLGAPSRGDWL